MEQKEDLQQRYALTSGFNAYIGNDVTKRVLKETETIAKIVHNTSESLMKLTRECCEWGVELWKVTYILGKLKTRHLFFCFLFFLWTLTVREI